MKAIETPTGGRRVVSQAEWTEARKALLEREKAHTAAGDALAAARRELPWVKVERQYVFDTSSGPRTLAELFEGRSQLIVYHFMLSPGWEHGCPSCSYVSDHIDGMLPHLRARDVAFAAVSRAPLNEVSAFKARMGWKFPWASSGGSSFNFDFHVSFTPDQMKDGAEYNYRTGPLPLPELPGVSVFYRDASGDVFHTYSAYARGVEALVGTYHALDLVPNGRDEAGLAHTMAWVRHHDRYEADYSVDPASGFPLPRTIPGGAAAAASSASSCCCASKG